MDTNAAREDRLSAIAERARDTLALSGNCAQTSFAVLQEEFELDGGDILKALTPFPGIALRGETCGAVVGCLMGIGLVHGRDSLEDWRGFLACIGPARRFCRQFEEQNGSTSCGSILEAKLGKPFNLADRDESRQYVASGGPQACGDMIAGAVQIAAGIIGKENRPG